MNERFPSILPTESKPGMKHTRQINENLYDVYKLIHVAEQIEPEEMSISDLAPLLKEECWDDANNIRIKPLDIVELHKDCGGDWAKMLKKNADWKEHIENVRDADYVNYPILMHDSELLDGLHRITHAIIDGAEQINFKNITALDEDMKYVDIHTES